MASQTQTQTTTETETEQQQPTSTTTQSCAPNVRVFRPRNAPAAASAGSNGNDPMPMQSPPLYLHPQHTAFVGGGNGDPGNMTSPPPVFQQHFVASSAAACRPPLPTLSANTEHRRRVREGPQRPIDDDMSSSSIPTRSSHAQPQQTVMQSAWSLFRNSGAAVSPTYSPHGETAASHSPEPIPARRPCLPYESPSNATEELANELWQREVLQHNSNMRTHKNFEPHPNPTTVTQQYDISGQQPFVPGSAGPSSGPNVFMQPGPYFVGENSYYDDGQHMHAVPEHGQFVPQQYTHAGHAHSPQMYHQDNAGTGNLINTYANEFMPDDMQQQYSHGGLNSMCQGQPFVPQHGISLKINPCTTPAQEPQVRMKIV